MDWDLTPYFPDFKHPKRVEFESELKAALALSLTHFDEAPALDVSTLGHWEALVSEYEGLGVRLSHLASYVHALVSANGEDTDYQQAESRLALHMAAFYKLDAQLVHACASPSDEVFAQWLQRPGLAGTGYALARKREQAQVAMTPELEGLAADLSTDGIHAWGRLYNTLTASLKFEMHYPDGTSESLPLSARRSLMEGNDRNVRKAAFEGGNAALKPLEPTLAAALNHIAGTRLSLYKRRGVQHFLDPAAFDGGITRSTLDAMFDAVERNIEIPREVLKLKARAAGQSEVAWYDIGSMFPLGSTEKVDWPQALSMVREAFTLKYPKLGRFFDKAIAERWVDYQPREGKRQGAFCTSSPLLRQSRVFMTFGGTLNDVSTLAHEIGHAFHSELMGKARHLEEEYPMTLAESASIFAELTLANGLLSAPDISPEQRHVLNAGLLNDAPSFLLDITTRFKFERAFYEQRASGEVSAERLGELMAETQRQVFGDVLAKDGTDPLFWASKLHFFISGTTFYNFPYTFGYLLSRGLYSRFEEEGAAFLPKYERFLQRSGSAAPAVIAREILGCDLNQPEFWEQSIQSLQKPLDALRSRLDGR